MKPPKPGTFKPMLKAQPSLVKQDGSKPSYLLSLIAYELVFLFVLVGLASVISIALEEMLPAKIASDVAGWIFLGSVVLYIVLIPVLLRRAAGARAELGLGFFRGLRYAFEEVRSMCCSLPLVGPLITPDSYLTREDDDESESDREPGGRNGDER